MTDASAPSARPPLFRDRSFWGMTATQFLGAFNDNVFKQLVLLLCVDYRHHSVVQKDPQSVAQGTFALAFVVLSGFSGWLSDRNRKRSIVVWAKVLEILVMTAGMLAFLSADLYSLELLVALMIVLFFMGAQSAYFGPSKYGILPELFAEHDLPKANGIIQMTTFLAIIFGMAVCGASKRFIESTGTGLWVVSAACVGIAVVGTLTSLPIRNTAVARPGLPLRASSFGIDRDTFQILKSDRELLTVLLISCLFWFMGGVLVPVVNDFGKTQMGYDDLITSLLAAMLGVGIAAGCVIAGQLSHQRINFGLVTRGAWGMAITLVAMSLVPHVPALQGAAEYVTGGLLMLLGASAGIFVVPLQVFLQARPPAEMKGRMIGAMNLMNWIAIFLAAGGYALCSLLFTSPATTPGGRPESAISWTFAVLAVLVLPVALRFSPPDEALE
jgi:acyl-[acyl-carrier-protein]-phospholipid O-acyltransferase/long-chain-fatty-acid--[acyl-carrier-protein] ligase